MNQYGIYDPHAEAGTPLFDVELCSGEIFRVRSEVEQRFFNQVKAKYLTETRFTETTDLQDLDRLLGLEVMLFRWNQHLFSGYDYENIPIEEETLRKQVKEQSEAITKLKTSLGLDKKARDQALNEGNFNAWFMDVKRRAKLFGLHRENQLNVALGLMNELSANIAAFDRSDEEERRKIGFQTEGDILRWVREEMIPKFKAVDEHFVQNEQRLWKRDL